MKYEEKEGHQANEIEILTQNIAALAVAVETQNDIIICLLHHLDKIPEWKDREELEKEMNPKIQGCIKAVRKAYGQLETDKS